MGTRTHTVTLTDQEQAVLDAVKVIRHGRPGKWTAEEVEEIIQANAESSELVDVPSDRIREILGDLTARGLVTLIQSDDTFRYTRA